MENEVVEHAIDVLLVLALFAAKAAIAMGGLSFL
jgi:hypothetical protein